MPRTESLMLVAVEEMIQSGVNRTSVERISCRSGSKPNTYQFNIKNIMQSLLWIPILVISASLAGQVVNAASVIRTFDLIS